MSDELIKKRQRLDRPLTINVDDSYKALYDTLNAKGIRVAEHLRRVIYPELERIQKLEQAAG